MKLIQGGGAMKFMQGGKKFIWGGGMKLIGVL